MPRLGFEPTITAFERAKIVRALDCVATVIGFTQYMVVTYLANICVTRH
jgi:predicted tellurium resistance membrane protein TerC